MTVEEFFQRVSVAGKAFTNAKCTQEQYLRYLANKLADVDPELGIDCNRIRVTPETAPRWPGLWKRINLAVGLIQKRKAPVENFPSYVHGLLMDFRMDLRETPAEKTKRADDDRVCLDPTQDPDAFRRLDSLDPDEASYLPGSFTEEDAQKLSAADPGEAPDNFDEVGGDF